MTHFLAFFKLKPVKWTLLGIGAAIVGIPVIVAAVPYVFPGVKAKAGSYLDVVEMKEISKLSVQRINFSEVMTATVPEGMETNLTQASVYVRRIMRGHVTSSVNLSDIKTNCVDGKLVVEFPALVAEPFIDAWIYYDSKGTDKKHDPREMTKAMDQAFRDDMMQFALQTGRVARAKEQAVRIVETLYPDLEFEPRWPENSKSGESTPVDAETKSETTETSHE